MNIKTLLKHIGLNDIFNSVQNNQADKPSAGEVLYSGIVKGLIVTVELVRNDTYLLSLNADEGLDVDNSDSMSVEFTVKGIEVFINDKHMDDALAVYERLGLIS